MNLVTTLNLQYGDILLSTSTKSQLQDLIENDGPFFANNTDLVKTCIFDSQCDGVQDIIVDLGKTLTFGLFICNKLAVSGVSRELSFHPVHLRGNTTDNFSPSALVPFCSYQGDFNLLGEQRVELQNMTLCDKFESTILDGQLCYSFDVTKFTRKPTKTGTQGGLFLLLDPHTNDRLPISYSLPDFQLI